MKLLWKKYSFIVLLIFLVLGLFDGRIALLAIVCMLGPIIYALLGKGRSWCGNICPRGSFYENILIKITPNNKVPALLRSSVFRLAIIIIMFSMFGIGIYKSWGDASAIGMVFYRMIFVTTVVGIILSFFYNHRTWCAFCPIGSISSFITHYVKPKNPLQVNSSCVNCRLCEKKCPMGISPYNYKDNHISHVDCINCEKCVYVCPKKSIKN